MEKPKLTLKYAGRDYTTKYRQSEVEQLKGKKTTFSDDVNKLPVLSTGENLTRSKSKNLMHEKSKEATKSTKKPREKDFTEEFDDTQRKITQGFEQLERIFAEQSDEENLRLIEKFLSH